MKERLLLINNFLSSQEELILIEQFVVLDKFFFGKIQLDAQPKTTLEFDVYIPISFPYSDGALSIIFKCTNIEGYRHINADRSICLRAPKHSDFESRLKLEIEALKEWRDRFYIREEKDERYEYLIIDNIGSPFNFLFTNVKEGFAKDEYGVFKAMTLPFLNENGGLIHENIFITQIGKRNCEWSMNPVMKPNTQGFYFFIDKEPVKKGRNSNSKAFAG